MRTLSTIAAAVLALVVSSSARAQGTESTGIGVGVTSTLTGLTGPTLTYQASRFHVEGVVGFHDDGFTEIDLAGRFWFQIHATATSDFSVGGGIGIESVDAGPVTDTDLHIEGGAQLRAFLASNVALGASLGLGIENGDDNADGDVEFLAGQLVGGLSVTYFFF
jgi:hypothetical protein